MNRIVVLALAASLAGCAMVSSQKPVFPQVPNKSALAGVYELYGGKDAITLLVRRHDAASYEAFLFDPNEPHEEFYAAEFSAVPLGAGDYVLQVSCLASRKDDGKGPWEVPLLSGFQYWTLAAARLRGDYWLGSNLTDDAANALSAKFGQVHDRDGGIKLESLPIDRALAFFSDWLGMQIAEGGDRMIPIAKKLDPLPTSAPFKNPTTCRQVAQAH
jgi:hypothetical protein